MVNLEPCSLNELATFNEDLQTETVDIAKAACIQCIDH